MKTTYEPDHREKSFNKSVSIERVTAGEAPNYNELNEKGENWDSLVMKKVFIIKKGTVEGRSTFDFQLEDSKGNKFVLMTTENILNGIVKLCPPAEGGKQ